MKDDIVLIGAGSIGQARTRRISAGKHVLLADLRLENADVKAKTLSIGLYCHLNYNKQNGMKIKLPIKKLP